MELPLVEHRLRQIAAALGMLQGLGYLLMAFLCIIYYNLDPPDFTVNSYWSIINQNLYYLYLSTDRSQFPGQTLYPKVFAVFVWIYFILHLAWFSASLALLRQKGAKLSTYMTAWSHLTFVISFWDFITVVILGADYSKCLKFASDFAMGNVIVEIGFQEVCSFGILTVLVIAARGFVLWIVNVVFALVMNKIALRLKKDGQVA